VSVVLPPIDLSKTYVCCVRLSVASIRLSVRWSLTLSDGRRPDKTQTIDEATQPEHLRASTSDVRDLEPVIRR